MTAAVLRAVEPARDEILDRIDRIPDLTQLDLPSLELIGRRADEAMARLRGRSRRPAWPWLVGGLVVVGVAIAAATALMTWNRGRATEWPDDALDGLDRASEPGSTIGSDRGTMSETPGSRGLTAVEGSLLSYDPIEARDA